VHLNEFLPVSRVAVHRCALLSMASATLGTDPHHHHLLLTAGTDGLCAVWDITQLCRDAITLLTNESLSSSVSIPTVVGVATAAALIPTPSMLTPIGVYRLHQSGVNTMIIHHTSDDPDRIRVVSGGDDGALSVLDLSMTTARSTPTMSIVSARVSSLATAHSSSIKAIISYDLHHIISVSMDQRVRTWQLPSISTTSTTTPATTASSSSPTTSMRLIDDVGMSVADVACIDFYGTTLLFAGHGIQTFTTSPPSSR
jgi:WD40 repeat protein